MFSITISMPEGPEVKHVVDQLNKYVTDNVCIIEGIKINSGRYLRHGPPEGFDKIKFPCLLKSVHCKGKFIWFQFDNFTMWNTLGMSGQWGFIKEKHSHQEFIVKGGRNFFFTDTRCFGTLKFCFSNEKLKKKLDKIGPSWLENLEITDFFHIFRKKSQKMNVCKFLMNQRYTSGIGNYLLSEILYASKINPWVTLKEVSNSEIIKIYENACRIAMASYLSNGVSVRTYKGIYEDKGEYTFNLKAYAQKDNPSIVAELGPHNRTIWWDPNIQK
tara:strand:+ start:14573 stop:15391 length:819 start_codon:yes stop_codon:yes gene_type:complete